MCSKALAFQQVGASSTDIFITLVISRFWLFTTLVAWLCVTELVFGIENTVLIRVI